MGTFNFMPGTAGVLVSASGVVKIERSTHWHEAQSKTLSADPDNAIYGKGHSQTAIPVETSWFNMEGYVSATVPTDSFSAIVSDRYYPSCCKTRLITNNEVKETYNYVDPTDTSLVKCDERWIAGVNNPDFPDFETHLKSWVSAKGAGEELVGRWENQSKSNYSVWDENFKGFEPNDAVQFSGSDLAVSTELTVGNKFGVMAVFVLSNRDTRPHLIKVEGDSGEYGSLYIDSPTGSIAAKIGSNTPRAVVEYASSYWNKPVLVGIKFDKNERNFTFFVKAIKQKEKSKTVNLHSQSAKFKFSFFETLNENSCEILDIALWKNLNEPTEWNNAIQAYTDIYGV